MRALILQIKFFTRIPVPVDVPFDDETFARGVIFAPAAGLLIGLILLAVFHVMDLVGKPALSVMAVIIAETMITGALHMDGLADTFDGIFSNRPKEKILDIMRDSRIGTNGTLGIILLLMAKFALLISMDFKEIGPVIAAMPVISRMSVAWCAGVSAYARSDHGLGRALIERTGKKEIFWATTIASAAAAALLVEKALPGIASVIIFTLLFTGYVKKKIGGVTGDILGAVIEISGIIFLLSMVIWKAVV